jgi:hypothetical protein
MILFTDRLASFTALWQQAQRLNPDLGADWFDDLESDRAIARLEWDPRPRLIL